MVDDIDMYSPKNLNKKLFIADRKYRCIYHYLNEDNTPSNDRYNEKYQKFIFNRCKNYSSDILNAKLEKSYNIYHYLVKIIYTNIIIFTVYALYMIV